MSTHHLTAFCDAIILTGEAAVESHALLVDGTSIVDIVGLRHVPDYARKVDCGGLILAPGLIDAQVNGGGNVLLNNTPTADACLAIAKAHRSRGTTGMLLTCISDTPHITRRAMDAVRQARQDDPGILGLHLEGPHLGADKRGVHRASALRPLSNTDFALYRREDGEVLLVTLAPENVVAADIQALSKHAIVSIGHSDAQPEQVKAALAAGATGFTHLYNGMSGLGARNPGVAGVALDDPDSWCGLIADGHHVAPEMIRLALRAKPTGKVFLVSDAMAPAASDAPQDFTLYGEPITVGNGRCSTANGGLAGSAACLLDCVRTCVVKAGIEFDEALRMASTYPAAFLGLGNRFGKLLPKYEANIITLNHKLELQEVWPAGNA